ncbi:MAG TPA: Asp-tRNA(Asn)/Glu-tRNA(Gln) amidotransferase subunit GatB [Vicinamibacteria bacterium]|jgi:aspartyl-tRNA(Asn)/glutamyl-tRNA(Gln) amidotransferase subunit B
MSAYETVIGLECHAQLLTRTKLFCACRAGFGDAPNTNVCPVCVGLPGALPVLNRRAVELATRMALAVSCRVNRDSVFARKNYFYPDLPKGYQISQYDRPLAEDGGVEIEAESGRKRIGIERIHMEEDAGKLLHEGFRDAAAKSGVDFNRSGVPLIEIVSRPELSSPEEAVAYAESLREILIYTGVSDADMEKGNFRCDGNVSLRPRGASGLGTKVEIKNLNSFRFLGRALAHEVERQAAVLESGSRVIQETRLYDPDADETHPMRSKEEAHDYRYFPDPDVPPLKLRAELVEEIARSIPELPSAKRERFAKEYGLPSYDASVLTTSRGLADYFEAAARRSGNPKATSNWVMSDVLRKLKETPTPPEAFAIAPEALGELIELVDRGKVSVKMAKEVFEKMYASGESAELILSREGLSQISDPAAIERIARTVVDAHPEAVAQYRSGDEKVLSFFVGQVMKATKGQANPKLAREALVRILTVSPA